MTDSSDNSRRFDGSSFHQESVQVVKEYEAVITSMTRQGNRFTRVQGFVKNVKAGQKVKVKEKVGNRHTTATMAF